MYVCRQLFSVYFSMMLKKKWHAKFIFVILVRLHLMLLLFFNEIGNFWPLAMVPYVEYMLAERMWSYTSLLAKGPFTYIQQTIHIITNFLSLSLYFRLFHIFIFFLYSINNNIMVFCRYIKMKILSNDWDAVYFISEVAI